LRNDFSHGWLWRAARQFPAPVPIHIIMRSEALVSVHPLVRGSDKNDFDFAIS
jgi:hypothetical protein